MSLTAFSADDYRDDLFAPDRAERRSSQVDPIVRKSAGVLLERGDLGFRVVDAKLQRVAVAEPQLEVRHNATFAGSKLVPALAERGRGPNSMN